MDKNFLQKIGLPIKSHEHQYSHCANKTLEFVREQEKKNFEDNVKKYPNDESLQFYLKNKLTYKFNNYGFRTEVDFKQGLEGNIYLGCSHTFGESLYYEDTWAYKVNQEVGGNFFNLGVPGTGIETGARLLLTYLKFLKVKNIFVHYPHLFRYEHFSPTEVTGLTTEWQTYLPSQQAGNKIGITKTLTHSYLHDTSVIPRHLASFYSILGQALKYNIPVYFVNVQEFNKNDRTARKARDLQHYSTYVHKNLKLDGIKKYNNRKQPGIEDLSVEYKELLENHYS